MSVTCSVQNQQRECNIKCGIFKKEVSGLNMAELDKEKRREERGKKSKKAALQGTE